jgi:hypothetical protein
MHFSSPLCIPHALPISSCFIWLPKQHPASSTDHEARHHAVFSSPVTLSVLALTLRSSLNERDQVSHPNKTKQKLGLQPCTFQSLFYWTAKRHTKDPIIAGQPWVQFALNVVWAGRALPLPSKQICLVMVMRLLHKLTNCQFCFAETCLLWNTAALCCYKAFVAHRRLPQKSAIRVLFFN